MFPYHNVKLARAKLPANASNFTCSSQIKRRHMQFTCVTCSLPVKTGKFTRVYAASILRRIHANYLQPHVNLPEHIGYLTSNFTCGTHANYPAIGMQNCLISQAKKNMQFAGKNTNNRKQKDPQSQAKIPAITGKKTTITGKNTRNCWQKYEPLQLKISAIAGKNKRHCS